MKYSTSALSRDLLYGDQISTAAGEDMQLSSRSLSVHALNVQGGALRTCGAPLWKLDLATNGPSESISASTSSAGKSGRRNFKTTRSSSTRPRCSATKSCGPFVSKWKSTRCSEIGVLGLETSTTFTLS